MADEDRSGQCWSSDSVMKTVIRIFDIRPYRLKGQHKTFQCAIKQLNITKIL